MKEATLPPKKSSPFAVIGAGIIGLVVFVALFVGFYHNEVPEELIESEVRVPAIEEKQAPREWKDETGFNLPPLGLLPSLQTAMKENRALRDKVAEFSQKTDAELFANYRQTDADVTMILLLWAGADISKAQKTREGLDPRVDRFLRRAFALGGIEPIVNNPRLGRDPWPRLFAHYKMRLIAQTQGGSMPFTGKMTYHLGRDRITLEKGGLSRNFFTAYGKFLKSQQNPVPFRNNLLSYIRAVDPQLLKDTQTLSYIQ